MELTGKIKVLAFASATMFSLVTMSYAQNDTSRSGFLMGLEVQEEQEYKKLVDRIQTMPEAEYTAFLQERLEQGFKGENGSIRTYIVVDVTTEVNRPEPSFLRSFFSSVPDPKQYGINKLDGLVKAMGNKALKRQTFELQDQYRSQNRVRHFQRIQGTLTKTEAKSLVGQADIIDLLISDTDKLGTEFITTHTPTGRMLPRRTQKNYSQEYIANGLYIELMDKFNERNVLPVAVGFKEPEGYEYTKTWNGRMAANIDMLLESWKHFEFEVLDRSHSYIILRTTKEHIQVIRENETVDVIKYKNYQSQILTN